MGLFLLFREISGAYGSSRKSQDRLKGPLPAKCWPEAFHATFIHNISEKRGRQDRMEKLRYPYQYHHNYLPPPLLPQLLLTALPYLLTTYNSY